MVKLREARDYVAAHATSYDNLVLVDRFFTSFAAGAHVVLGAHERFASADYFRRSTDQLFYLFVYRFTEADRSRLTFACISFKDRALIQGEWKAIVEHANSYVADFCQTDATDDVVIASLASPGYPIDGAYMIVGHEHEQFARHRSYHVTRPYITSEHSRMLLYNALIETYKLLSF